MTRATPRVVLRRLVGGWGNQAFQMCAINQLNDGRFYTHRSQSVSGGYVDSPAYFKGEVVRPLVCRHLMIDQFEHREIRGRIPVVVDGMFMNFGYLDGMTAADSRATLLSTPEPEPLHADQRPLCLLGFRSFSEENRHDWRLGLKYYEHAIERLGPGYQFLCLGDDTNFVETAVQRLGIADDAQIVQTTPGQRDRDHIERQLRLAARCSAYILSNSSFHLWAPLMSYSADPKVIYPAVHWMDLIGVPNRWDAVALD